MIESIYVELDNAVRMSQISQVATESSNPLEYAINNPLQASAMLIGAVAVGLTGRWFKA